LRVVAIDLALEHFAASEGVCAGEVRMRDSGGAVLVQLDRGGVEQVAAHARPGEEADLALADMNALSSKRNSTTSIASRIMYFLCCRTLDFAFARAPACRC
jgi:hypothetical protein